MITLPEFKTIKERNKFLFLNQDKLKAIKKASFKSADAFEFGALPIIDKKIADKANNPIPNLVDLNEIKVQAIINTTNLFDSHSDVHIPGLWNKSIQENKFMMHLKSHKMDFEYIISDGEDLETLVKNFKWSDLGFDYKGITEALTFNSLIKRSRNEFMFDQYGKGFVKNHSVGMKYVRLTMAINDEEYGANYEAWEKYFPQIVNADAAEEQGYFWAVKEAKAIEGSAVVRGSNFATPTQDNNMKELAEPLDQHSGNKVEPPKGTLTINADKILNQLNF